MKAQAAFRKTVAFTRVELLVIIAIVALLAALSCSLRSLRSSHRAIAKNCLNNLKKVGLAFRISTLDAGDSYPMGLSTNSGGTKELIDTGQVFVHFRALSNELSTPKVLICPGDKAKTIATNFNSGFSDANVSYFVGIDAAESYPGMFLSGDRNLAFDGRPLKPGLFLLATNNPSLSWTKPIHDSCGNMALADGSIQFFDSMHLAMAARDQGFPTNRLAIP